MSHKMDEYHREIILTNIDTLTEWTNYDKLKEDCIDRNLLSLGTVKEIEKVSANLKLKHFNLLTKITETGPHAFIALVDICRSNFWDADEFLASFNRPDCVDRMTESVKVETDGNFLSRIKRKSVETISLEEFTEPVDASSLHVIKADRFHSSKILSNSMKSKNRGVLFLVNIIEIKNEPDQYRNGAIGDKMKLIKLFRELGFKIFYYESITLSEFRHLVDELIKSTYLRKTDCLVFAVLSHGFFKDGHQMIKFGDGQIGSIEDVIAKFSNISCPNMAKKPKVFIFPMCRGISRKIKVKTFDVPNTHLKGGSMPAFSDIKICYGSVKGFDTFRDEKIGSWYIHTFCEIMASHAHCEHFADMQLLIGQQLESHCQKRSNGNENFVQTISSTPFLQSWIFRVKLIFYYIDESLRHLEEKDLLEK